jgi:outer membrane immunogenic protein
VGGDVTAFPDAREVAMKVTLLGGAAATLLSVSAFGADLGLPPATPPAPFSWTGCYGGGQVGGGFGQKDLTDTVGTCAGFSGFASGNLNISGYMLGAQIGCDYQFASNWVIGIEGAAAGGNIGGNTAVVQPAAIAGDSATFKETTDFLTSTTARIGFTWDQWLLYAKGGAAWAGDRYSAIGVFQGTPYDLEGLETRLGWTAGGGIEWALWRSWSVKLEYDYYGFGSRSVTFIDPNTGNTGPANIKQNIQVIMLGLNFHPFFGP